MQKFQVLPSLKINDKENQFHPRHTIKNEKVILKKKNFDFQFQKVFPITISEGNGRAEIEKNNFNGTFVYDDDAHKVVLCTCSPFFCTRWVLLRNQF